MPDLIDESELKLRDYELRRHDYLLRVIEPSLQRAIRLSTIVLGGHIAALAIIFSVLKDIKTSQAWQAIVEPGVMFFLGACCAILSIAAAALISYNLSLWLTAVGFNDFDDTKLPTSSRMQFYFGSRLLSPIRTILILAIGASVVLFMWGVVRLAQATPVILGF